MRRLALLALAAAIGCRELSDVQSGPTGQLYRPTGLAVHEGRLVVASSNSDLRFDGSTGGTVIAVDPATAATGGVQIESFAGELAIADPAACPAMSGARPLALVPVRGANLLYRVPIEADGSLTCEGCAIPLSSGQTADPFSVAVACDGAGFARAYVGHLRSEGGLAWVSEIDLATGQVRHASTFGLGELRGFAFDAPRRRLYMAQSSTSSGGLRWLDLAGGCAIDAPAVADRCSGGIAALPPGLELRDVALSSSAAAPRRAYLTARIFDLDLAAASGFVGDADGVLLVADLLEDVGGNTQLRIVNHFAMGFGAASVAVLPSRGAGRGDVVAALAIDAGELWVYDDESGARTAIGRDASGRPLLGRTPFGLAVDPVVIPDPNGDRARVYVGSFEESFVNALDVPLGDVEGTSVVRTIGPVVTP